MSDINIKAPFQNGAGSEQGKAGFSKAALNQASAAASLRIASVLGRRLDLRGRLAFTFGHPKQAESASRAFSLSKKKGFYRLDIHIADAAEYIRPGSPLDTESLARGAEIVAEREVIPMLPEAFTREACGLAANCNRLAVTVTLDISPDGKLLGMTFDESVVRVAQDCVYEEIDSLYSNPDSSAVLALRSKYAPLLPILNDMYELGAVLCAQRLERGGVPPELPRRTFILKDGEPQAFEIGYEQDSALLIREFLLFAGFAAAEYTIKNKIPCIYAVQPPLPDDKLAEIARICGITPPSGEISAAERAASVLQEATRSRNSATALVMASDSFPALEYSLSPEANSLFGAPVVRFSSPLTRFSDLAVQRLFKDIISGGVFANSPSVRALPEAARLTQQAGRTEKEKASALARENAAKLIAKSNRGVTEAVITGTEGAKITVYSQAGLSGVLEASGSVKYTPGERIKAVFTGIGRDGGVFKVL